MKLKTKLLMPLMGIISTAAVIAPIATSCGNNGGGGQEETVAGKILINKLSVIDDVEMTSSKETFTNKEADEGFSVTFTIDESTQEYVSPVFVLDKITVGGNELENDKYSVQYNEDVGFLATSFVVTLKPGVPKNDLTFSLRFNADVNEISVIENWPDHHEGSVTLNPTAIDWLDWDGTISLTWSGGGTIIDYPEILYSDETVTTDDMESLTLVKNKDWTSSDVQESTSQVTFTDSGYDRLVEAFASYVYVKVRVNWMHHDE